MSLPTLRVSVACCVLGLPACSLDKTAHTAPTTAFLAAAGSHGGSQLRRLPFDHSWKARSVDVSQYKMIVVRPVTTAYLRKDEWKESSRTPTHTHKAYLKQSKELARYFSAALKRAFASPVCGYYLTDSPNQPGTLILEVALTEVISGRPAGDPGAMAASGGSSPGVAFEARVRDAASGKTIATVADRRGSQFKLLGDKPSSYAKANQEICDEWSLELMRATNKEIFPTVSRSWLAPF